MSDRIKDAVNSTAANLGGSDVPVRHARIVDCQVPFKHGWCYDSLLSRAKRELTFWV